MSTAAHGVPFRQAVRVWARIGLNSFGGPAGQIAVMHREVVEQRRWVSERRFLHALNYCMVLPGPEAQQLSCYLGWLMHGVRGGVAAGVLFVLPGFVVMLVLAAGYAAFGDVSWVAGLLFGIQAAVVAIVAEAVIRIGRRTLRSRFLQLTAGLSFVAVFALAVPFPLLVLLAAAAGLVAGRRHPQWFPASRQEPEAGPGPGTLLPDEQVPVSAASGALRAAAVCLLLWLTPPVVLLLVLGPADLFTQQSLLFSKSAVITFGGAYAALGYVAQQAVGRFGWVSPADMVAGLGLAETTPGPLVLVLQFVGFLTGYHRPGSLPPLLAGLLGAGVAVWATFLPCFLFIFAGAPYVERLRDHLPLGHALVAISAAVAGVVLNLAVWFAVHTAFGAVDDRGLHPLAVPMPHWSSLRWSSLAVSTLAAALVFRLRMSTLRVIGVCAAVGLVVSLAG